MVMRMLFAFTRCHLDGLDYAPIAPPVTFVPRSAPGLQRCRTFLRARLRAGTHAEHS